MSCQAVSKLWCGDWCKKSQSKATAFLLQLRQFLQAVSLLYQRLS